jgi:cytochrome c oxidase cbb3-type subunit 3
VSDFTPSRPAQGESVDVERSHAFDGITEYDNNLPRWWLWTLYLSSAFAVWYIFHFHFWTGVLSREDVENYMQPFVNPPAQQQAKAKTEEQLRLLSKDPSVVAKGKAIVPKALCMTCHGPELTGLIGPNLRDRHWLYGSSMTALIETLTLGRGNGLMPGQAVTKLSGEEIEAVASYIVSLNREGEKPGMRPQAAREKEDPITY